jgi:hypothetical protein
MLENGQSVIARVFEGESRERYVDHCCRGCVLWIIVIGGLVAAEEAIRGARQHG